MTIHCTPQAQAGAGEITLGQGAYTTALHAGGERVPPATVYRSAALTGPVPTNKWHSSLLFTQWSQPLFAHPVTYQAGADGFELGLPDKRVSISPTREETDIAYPHRAALTVSPLGFAMRDARAGKVSDWALDIVMGDGSDALTATIAHGSPFSYYQLSRGDAKIRTEGAVEIFHRSADGKVLGLKVEDKFYALFLPTGAHWQSEDSACGHSLTLHLPDGARYFSIAALPDTDLASTSTTIDAFGKYAYAFITDTRVSWHYDQAKSQVITTFSVTTDVKEGPESEAGGTLMGLYPHQWHANALLGADAVLPFQYDTVRGKMKLVAGRQFQTSATYPGMLPYWPGLTEPKQAAKLAGFLDADLLAGAEFALGRGSTYWEGKGFGRAMQLMSIAEQQGDMVKRDALLQAMKARMETWLRSTTDGNKYFHYEPNIGTLIGYPDEYGSAAEVNDHHFHYGYWIFAAAQIALRDPAWAAKERWGGMIDLLVADIASTDRQSKMFPFLRNFDPYEGHSWASGIVPFFDGNNQESSSEAINAWAGMILWGEATGNQTLRDTGIYLYTTEIQALNHYWFDLHHLVFAPEYRNVEASMVWGGKYVHTTWFTEDPREIHGINMLPITTASLYLGTDPAFVKRNIDAMDGEFAKYLRSDREHHVSPETWQDILLEYYALYDPQEALARWNENGLVEGGESSSHTYHWLQSLVNMGQPDFSVTADTPFYAVLRDKAGKKTYLAYNAGTEKKTVTFSDGKKLAVPPRGLKSASVK